MAGALPALRQMAVAHSTAHVGAPGRSRPEHALQPRPSLRLYPGKGHEAFASQRPSGMIQGVLRQRLPQDLPQDHLRRQKGAHDARAIEARSHQHGAMPVGNAADQRKSVQAPHILTDAFIHRGIRGKPPLQNALQQRHTRLMILACAPQRPSAAQRIPERMQPQSAVAHGQKRCMNRIASGKRPASLHTRLQQG